MKNGQTYKYSILFLLHITAHALVDCNHYIVTKAKAAIAWPKKISERKLHVISFYII